MRPYSYSRWGTYKNCPRKFKLAYRSGPRTRTPPGPAAARGLDIHGTAEDYLNGEGELHAEISGHLPFFSDLRDRCAIPEAKFSFDENWEVCGWDDPECYFRGLWDIHLASADPHELTVWELKTGKKYDDHVYQRDLYGPAALLTYPEYEGVEVINVYLDQGYNTGGYYSRDELQNHLDVWKRRTDVIEEDDLFIPVPSYACRWCDFSRHNGGPCEF